jgi:hypothetical protein
LKLLTAVCFLGASMGVSGVRAAEPSANARLDENLRCFATMSVLMTLDDPEAHKLGEMGGLYFMGRLDGALTDKEFEDRLFAFSQNMPNEDMPKLMTRCGEIMQTHGAVVQEIGRRVSVREEAAAAAAKK